MMEKLHTFYKFLEDIEEQRARMASLTQDEALDGGLAQHLRGRANYWRHHMLKHGFIELDQLLLQLDQDSRNLTHGVAADRLGQIAKAFREVSGNREIYVVGRSGCAYVERSGFGPEVQVAFPASHVEINAARHCYALGQPTACVFHLMRAVEHGLRELAACSGITNPKVAIEFQFWNELIEQVDRNYRTATMQWSKGAEKSAALAFFGATVSSLYGFKDDVRNILMHARTGGLYDEARALSVMGQVETFMKRLASRISENCGADLLAPGAWT